MRLSRIYERLVLISPYVEVLLRHIYWSNVDLLKKYSPNKVKNTSKRISREVDFERVIEWLKEKGIGEGDLLIVHSGYGELERTGLSPEEIVERLLQLVGPTGTLAMPVIRRFKDMEKAKKEGRDLSQLTFKYNVKKTLLASGMLPYTLMQREDAVISHHPFNPLCAVGPLAKAMMEHNLDGDAPSPHGPNSCWKYCYDHGAKVCAIGTDIEHHNTIMHIAEEAFGNWAWDDETWYNRYCFEIIDEKKESKLVTVRNRKDEWGRLQIAELNVCKAEKKADAMISDCVAGMPMGYVDPQKTVELLQKKNKRDTPISCYL